MDVIRLLPDSVANQIAAGEVIQRPSSCLKELVENALDAGASRVQVIVRDAGRTLLQVVDNGTGMSETDVRMAFERHATSKIHDASDLFGLRTMGFRGEALPSICAVSQVEVQTRKEGQELGSLLEISGSEVQRQEPVQCAVGTNIKVRNLFFNVPARRKFLKSDRTELQNLQQEFFRIVLVNPSVQFLFVSQDEILFDLPAATEKQRIEAVFGKSQRQNYTHSLVDIHAESPLVSLHGFVGKPESAGRTPRQYFFVNRRFMRHSYFHKAVMTAYEGMLPNGVMPSYFIYFDIAPDAIDVNIHPAKTEIKFADEQLIYPIVLAAVREALGKFNVAPSLDFDVSGRVEMPVPSASSGRERNAGITLPVTSDSRSADSYNPFSGFNNRQLPKQWQTLYPERKEEEGDNLLFDVPEESVWQGKTLQIADKYIVFPSADGMAVVHRQRAHVCVLYRQLMQRIQQTGGERQSLLFPDIWDVDAEDLPLVERLTADLSVLGFDMERIAKFSFSISAVPAILPSGQAIASLQRILADVRETGEDVGRQWREKVALSLAYSAAIPSGKPIAETEAEDLLHRLFALPACRFTPDGKAVVAQLGGNRLSSLF